jgi:hypothetical protein
MLNACLQTSGCLASSGEEPVRLATVKGPSELRPELLIPRGLRRLARKRISGDSGKLG